VIRLLRGLASLLLALLISATARPTGATAAPGEPCPGGGGPFVDYCAGDELETPATPTEQGPEPLRGPAPGAGQPACIWTHQPGPNPNLPEDGGLPWSEVIGAPSPGAGFYAEECDGSYTGRVRWVPAATPGPGAAPPSPEQLASVVRVRLEGRLPAPRVQTTPGPGVAAFVGYPSFVAVSNWTGVVRDRECDPSGVLCVNVTATPTMRWSPGEPEAPAKECAGPGVAFDPNGDPFEQAASPEACAYPYLLRTGVHGRPDAWPGEVTVMWALEWSSTSGAGGSLPPVEKSAAVPRAVDEVQTVVVSAGE
jgi:hypothetical protein